MRKGRRFSQKLIKKWLEEGRGSGVYDDYQALHQVTRADPGSQGLSRILNQINTSRSEYLLSDTEYGVYLFARMVPGLVDLREQFHLSQDSSKHELSAYEHSKYVVDFPGTREVADELNIRHPKIRYESNSYWPISTDLLLTLQLKKKFSLLAISVKPEGELSKRTQQLISIESNYWKKRNVEFLLITPATYLRSVMINLKTYSPWGHAQSDMEAILQVGNLAKQIDGLALSKAMKLVQESLKLSYEVAQNVFWASVWKGVLPINLDRRATSGTPVNLLPIDAFWKQNPIVSRRSVWQP